MALSTRNLVANNIKHFPPSIKQKHFTGLIINTEAGDIADWENFQCPWNQWIFLLFCSCF